MVSPLKESDIPGSSLKDRDPSELKIPELKCGFSVGPLLQKGRRQTLLNGKG